MWGQTQSAMISETKFLHLGPINKWLNTGITESLSILKEGVYGNYMTKESVAAWSENSQQYFDKARTEEIFAAIEQVLTEYYAFGEDIRTRDLASLSMKELAALFAEYKRLMGESQALFGSSTPSGTFAVEQRIKELVNNEEDFIQLSTPAEEDSTMQERREFRALARAGATDDELLAHARRYPALFFNTFDVQEALEYLRMRAQQEHDQAPLDFSQHLADIKKKHQEIYDAIGKDELPYFAGILQRAGLGRYRLKHVWSGIEFLCLDLLKEIAKRIGLDTRTLIRTYMHSDIEAFFQNGTTLTEQEIKDRTTCILLHWHDKRQERYFGEEALIKRKALLGEQKKKPESIKGMVANKGAIEGRARVVLVNDIKQMLEDANAFQKGEILVTTMTSPAMVPVIEKAAAIVTDEGGICSHAAVIAREFGIPCIIGTHNATSTIATGDTIRISETGEIEIQR